MTRRLKTITQRTPAARSVNPKPKPQQPYPTSLLLPATKADIHELARTELEALSSNLLLRLYFPDPTQFYRALVSTLEELFEDGASTSWIVKAVSEKGEMMGWGYWSVKSSELPLASDDGRSFDEWLMVKPEARVEGAEVVVPGTFPCLAGLPEFVRDHSRSVKNEWNLGPRHLVLNAMFTNPKYKGRGVAAAILDWGARRADFVNLPCWVQSTPEAEALLKREGWKDVGILDVDLKEWVDGGVRGMGWGVYSISYLLRVPRDRGEEERARLVKKLKVSGLGKDQDAMVWGVDFL